MLITSTYIILQGVAFVGSKVPISYPLVCPSSPLQNSFIQRNFQPFFYQKKVSFQPSRAYRGRILAEAEKKGWDVGRFLKTLYFFNGPPSPAKVHLAWSFLDSFWILYYIYNTLTNFIYIWSCLNFWLRNSLVPQLAKQ